ncbi:VOC family protein [Rathayibacter soli]|uniref:VOC family protein n=1 Tax=Rathayibacter soli TaxID=3144168 RepID=UPI0027E52BA3|nr:VOC family protein [Glaciibacter superstes]
MNLVSVRLITDNIRRLVEFYERALGIAAVWSTEDFAELPTASGTVAIGSTRTVGVFAPGAAHGADNHTAIIEFLVEEVDRDFERLEQWVSDVVTPPTMMPWGNRSAVIRDPDGNLLNFFAPVTADAVKKFAQRAR